MARRNYLVEGLSGAGKSSVYEELIRRGYRAVSTDRAWKYHGDPDTGLPGAPRLHANALWNEEKALRELEKPEPDVLFVCGSSRNRDRFLPYFTEVFNLRIDDDTMRQRLRERTNNDFGKSPEELELMLALNRKDERPAGAIDVDATRPLEQVVDDVVRLAGCDAVSGASGMTPWSKSGSEIGEAFVISESALGTVEAAAGDLRDVLGREALTRVAFMWSASVLATLVPYLEAHGIDFTASDDQNVAFTVLTPGHRERYLARLDPAMFDGAVLRRHYEALTDGAADGVEYAMLDGVAFLRDTLAPLEPGTVAVLVIG